MIERHDDELLVMSVADLKVARDRVDTAIAVSTNRVERARLFEYRRKVEMHLHVATEIADAPPLTVDTKHVVRTLLGYVRASTNSVPLADAA